MAFPATLTCASCSKTFPANHELATVPQAARVAFDPKRGRVWRVCSCGYWNLLGQDASAAAMPELLARSNAAAVRHLDGVALTSVSEECELIRVDPSLSPGKDDKRYLIRRKEILTTTTLRFAGMAVFVSWLFTRMSHGGIVDGVIALATFWAFMVAVLALRPLYHGRRFVWWHFVAPLAGFIFASYLGFRAHPGGTIGGYIFFWSMALIFMPLAPMRAFNGKLSNGRKLAIDVEFLDDVTLDWDDRGVITLHGVQHAGTVHGENAVTVLRGLLTWLHKEKIPTRASTGRALELVQSVGGLPGILALLDGYRRDEDGRVLLRALPRTYIIALDLVTAKGKLPTSSEGGLSAAATEATEIAAEAERLEVGS